MSMCTLYGHLSNNTGLLSSPLLYTVSIVPSIPQYKFPPPPLGPLAIHLSDADFGLHILQALLQHGDECPGWNDGAIDSGLVDVALQTKRKR